MKKLLATLLSSALLAASAQAGVVWTYDFSAAQGFTDGTLSGQNNFLGHNQVGTSAQVDTTAGTSTTTGNWLGNNNSVTSGALAAGDWVELEVNMSSSTAFSDPGAGNNLGNTDIIRVGFSDLAQGFPGNSPNGISGKLRFGQWYSTAFNDNSGALTVVSNIADTANNDTGRLLGAAQTVGIEGNATLGDAQDLTFDNLRITYRATMTATANEWDISMNLFNTTTSTDFGTHTYAAVSAASMYTDAQATGVRAGFRTFNINKLDSVVVDSITFSENIAPIPEPSSTLLTLLAAGFMIRRKR